MGLDLGFERGGLPPTLAVENDKWCCETISANRPDISLLPLDVSKLSAAELYAARNRSSEIFAMIGGPPCQSFCTAGNRAALSDPRGNLFYEYLRLVAAVRPQYFIIENVANLLTAAIKHRPIKDRPGQSWNLKQYANSNRANEEGEVPMEMDELSGSVVRQVVRDIVKMDYSINFGVLNSADYGAPQQRLRFILIGSRDHAAPELPKPTHGPRSITGIPHVTLSDAIRDLAHSPGSHSSYTEDVRKLFEMVPAGGNWRHLPVSLHEKALGGSFLAGGGKTGFFRRLSWDMPAPALTGKPNRKGTALCHPEYTRPLSVPEYARIQGFPDEWRFSGAMNQQYQQIGNAVPVPLGAAIAQTIVAHAKGIKQKKRSQSDADLDAMMHRAVTQLHSYARNRVKKKETLKLFSGAQYE